MSSLSMSHWSTLLTSTEAVAAYVWIAQMVLTPLVAKLSRSGKAWRLVRALHGLFDKIDPSGEK